MMKLIDKYIDYLRYERNYSSYTEISYLIDLTQFAEFLKTQCEDVSLLDVDSDVVRQWVVSLVSAKVNPRSVNRKLSSLKSFYKYLQKIDLVVDNPAKKVVAPKMKKPIPTFVKAQDMDLLLEEDARDDLSFEEVRDQLVLELFYVTGIRRAELIGISNVDVDFYGKTLRVTGKRNKQRLIPLSDEICSKLQKYMQLRDAEVSHQSDSLFVRENGEPLYPMLVYRIISGRLKSLATLSKTSPHVLRHSFATVMLNNGADINAVKEILGHASLAATEIYTHTSFEELKSIYNKAHPRA